MKPKVTPISEPELTPEPTPEAIAPALPRKLGANHSETAAHPSKHHNNFKQSRDLREDRGVRQLKASPKNRPQKSG